MAATRERVLITGAGGFLGACLTHDLAAADNDVHLLLRPTSDPWRLAGVLDRCNIHRADLLDEAALYRIVAACRPEVVYHLAGYGVAPGERDRPTLLATNVYGLGNLLSALAGHDYRALVCAGTCWEYGQSDRPL